MGYKKGINPWGITMSGIQRWHFRVILLAVTISTLLACSSSRSEKDNVFKQAEKGDAKAQFVLGLKYDTGKGVPQDYAEAAKWYRKAAEQGYAEAQFNLGTMYDVGRGVRQDYAEAAKWYRKAKDQGVASAQ
jgi:TPR repeat protein